MNNDDKIIHISVGALKHQFQESLKIIKQEYVSGCEYGDMVIMGAEILIEELEKWLKLVSI